MINLSHFSIRLNQLREAANLSMGELSRKIGSISQSTLSNYETGKREPKLKNLIELSRYFNCSTDYLTGESDIKDQENLIKTIADSGNSLNDITVALNLFEEAQLTLDQFNQFIELLTKIKENLIKAV